ncbi:hypothetical protein Tco_0885537 [Tanacetum coccineum]
MYNLGVIIFLYGLQARRPYSARSIINIELEKRPVVVDGHVNKTSNNSDFYYRRECLVKVNSFSLITHLHPISFLPGGKLVTSQVLGSMVLLRLTEKQYCPQKWKIVPPYCPYGMCEYFASDGFPSDSSSLTSLSVPSMKDNSLVPSSDLVSASLLGSIVMYRFARVLFQEFGCTNIHIHKINDQPSCLVYLRFKTDVGRTSAMDLVEEIKFDWDLKVKPGKKERALTQAK